jgi:hypothetical protein
LIPSNAACSAADIALNAIDLGDSLKNTLIFDGGVAISQKIE